MKVTILKSGGKLSASKAREMLEDGTANGKKLTKKQKRYFGMVAHGKADDGSSITPIGIDTIKFNGPSHEKGGIDIAYGGKKVEVEGDETGYKADDGSLIIMGNMTVPGTNKKFKTVSKQLAEKERRVQERILEGTDMVNTSDPNDKWGMLKFNSGVANMKGGKAKLAQIGQNKEWIGKLQEAMLELSDDLGVDPQELSKGNLKARKGLRIDAQMGKTIPATPTSRDKYIEMLKAAALKNGVDFETLKRVVFQESGFNPAAVSTKGAIGIMQMVPGTAKKYGISKAQLASTKDEDVAAVMDAATKHFKDLLEANNGDQKLALAAYNGGQGAVDFVKKRTKDPNLTGDEWIEYMQSRRQKSPSKNIHAWQNETLDYVATISGTNDEEFYTKKGEEFRNKYYVKQKEEFLREMNTGLPKVPGKPETPGIKSGPYRKVQEQPYGFDFKEPRPLNAPTDATDMDLTQFMGEAYAAATNHEEPVWAQRYEPQLFNPYQVSFQDRLNENAGTFNALQRYSADNPSALATLAAGKYSADTNVLGEQFLTNQAISNDITNKNVALLNDAQLKNLSIADTQAVRQSTAKSITKGTTQALLNSVSSKILQHELENKTLQVYENLYPYYRFGEDSKKDYYGPGADEVISINSGTPNTGMTEAQRQRQEFDGNGALKKTTVTTPSSLETAMKNAQLQKIKYAPITQMLNKGKKQGKYTLLDPSLWMQ